MSHKKAVQYPKMLHVLPQTIALAITLVLAAASAGCAKAAEPATHNSESMPTEHSHQPGPHSEIGAMKGMSGMSMTGDVDHDFASNMRMHHQMALKMAQKQIDAGRNPQMIQLAKDIQVTQKKEIAVLDRWLSTHKAAMSNPGPMPK